MKYTCSMFTWLNLKIKDSNLFNLYLEHYNNCNNFSHCIVLRKLFDPDHFHIWTWHVVWCQNFLLSSSTSILTLKVPKSSIHTLKVVGEQFSLPYQCPSARENTFKSLLKKMELFWPSRVGKHSGRGCPGSSLILDS